MRKSIKHIILAVSAVIAGAACEKAPETPALQAARIDVTISTHLNEDGAIDQAVWSTRDVVGFLFTESALFRHKICKNLANFNAIILSYFFF